MMKNSIIQITIFVLITFFLCKSSFSQSNYCGFDQFLKNDSSTNHVLNENQKKYNEWRKSNINARTSRNPNFSTINYDKHNTTVDQNFTKVKGKVNSKAINECGSPCSYSFNVVASGNAPATIGGIVTATNFNGGDIVRINNMVYGNTYRIYTCGQNDFDTELIVYTFGGGTCIEYNDDAPCGNGQSEIWFTPSNSGSYDIQINEYNCGTTFISNTDIFIELEHTNGTCGYNNNIYQTISSPTILNQTVSVTQTYGGEFNRLNNMIAGNTYRVSTCGNTAFDTQLSIFTSGGGQAVGFNDDACGLQSEIFFTPSTSGNYDVLIDAFPCSSNSIDMTLNIQLVYIQRPIITIPVVVHVIYENATENISMAQIQSQIDVLNDDFLMQHSGLSTITAPFRGVASNPLIQFCLAQQDPSGNPTNGVERINTFKADFGTATSPAPFDTTLYYTSLGGADPWDRNNYLNIWVCDFMGTPNYNNSGIGFPKIPLFPTFYQGLGVVLDHRSFGTIGTVIPNSTFQFGKNAVHEIGHWLGLWHMWMGQTPALDCESDSISDTPFASDFNAGTPLDVTLFDQCTNSYPGLMFWNYMDYTHDVARNMFTYEQAGRMDYALFNWYGSLQTSVGCDPPTATKVEVTNEKNEVNIYPNPNNGTFNINIGDISTLKKVIIIDALGKIILKKDVKSNNYFIENIAVGLYIVTVEFEEQTIHKKIIIN